MIPTEDQSRMLWDTYQFPEKKRLHVEWVLRTCRYLAKQCKKANPDCQINEPLLIAGALLHDIDKHIPKRPGEQHPDTGVRILREEGMGEVADLIQSHSLYSILGERTAPASLEAKLLFLADKLCKYDCIGVEKRFDLWRAEDLSEHDRAQLDASYPKVKALEREICEMIGIASEEVVKRVHEEYT